MGSIRKNGKAGGTGRERCSNDAAGTTAGVSDQSVPGGWTAIWNERRFARRFACSRCSTTACRRPSAGFYVQALIEQDDAAVRGLAVLWSVELLQTPDAAKQKQVVQVLLKLSQDSSLDVQAATLALGRLRDPAAIERLRGAAASGAANGTSGGGTIACRAGARGTAC